MRWPFRRKKKKIGIALSGGGTRCIGHIGVLKALEEYGLKPTVLSGTSAGAIVAAFYAAGYTPDEMLAIVAGNHFFPRSAIRFRMSGLFHTEFLERLFQEHFPGDDIAGLKLPLYIAATDLGEGAIRYFSEGSLSRALLASASIPFVFPQMTDGERSYVDGGILNNMPIEPLRGKCDMLIGVHVNAPGPTDPHRMGVRKLFDRVVHLAIGSHVYGKAGLCDLFIDPPDMTRFSMFDKKDFAAIFQYVYDYTVALLEERGYKRKMLSATEG